jgi:hypothetical protein
MAEKDGTRQRKKADIPYLKEETDHDEAKKYILIANADDSESPVSIQFLFILTILSLFTHLFGISAGDFVV